MVKSIVRTATFEKGNGKKYKKAIKMQRRSGCLRKRKEQRSGARRKRRQ